MDAEQTQGSAGDQPQEPQDEEYEIVCIGVTVDDKGKLRQWWRIVEEDGTLSPDRSWGDKPLVGHATVGSVYIAKGTKIEGRLHIYTTGKNAPRYSRRYPDEEEVFQWKLRSDTEQVRYAAIKRQEKDAKENPLDVHLLPLREAYRNTNVSGRKALLAVIMEYITR